MVFCPKIEDSWQWIEKPVKNTFQANIPTKVCCIVLWDLNSNCVEGKHDSPETEDQERFECILSYTVVCPVAVVIHHFHTFVALATMVYIWWFTYRRTFLTYFIVNVRFIACGINISWITITGLKMRPQQHYVEENNVDYFRVKVIHAVKWIIPIVNDEGLYAKKNEECTFVNQRKTNLIPNWSHFFIILTGKKIQTAASCQN